MPDEVKKAVITPEKETAMVDWESSPRVRAPWIKENLKYGKWVLPPNEQDNPQPLTNEMVLQKRDEPIGNSSAPPISGIGQDHGASESSRSKQIYSDSGASGHNA